VILMAAPTPLVAEIVATDWAMLGLGFVVAVVAVEKLVWLVRLVKPNGGNGSRSASWGMRSLRGMVEDVHGWMSREHPTSTGRKLVWTDPEWERRLMEVMERLLTTSERLEEALRAHGNATRLLTEVLREVTAQNRELRQVVDQTREMVATLIARSGGGSDNAA